MRSDWGRDDLMVVAAFRYCLGRQTYIVGDCADWMVANWDKFNANTQSVIRRDLEVEFENDDIARAENRDYKSLGHDCDRREWEKVRALYR